MTKTLKQIMMQRLIRTIFPALLAACLCPLTLHAQVTIDQCMEMARENYPQVKQLGLIEEAARYDIASVAKSWLPHFTVSGKASYQSDVVEMPFDIPGFSFNLPHDQYSLVGEISQTIWDGGTSGSQKRVTESGADVQKEQVEVSLYALNERVEKIFLGILLIDGQLEQNDILEKSLERNAGQVRACMENGTAYRSDLEMIEVSMLDCEQQRDELLKDREAYVSMLERLLSLQGGVGRPGLNILKNSFQPYWTAGVKMSWDIGALYTRKDEKRKLDAQMRKIESDRETFLLNTGLDATQMQASIDKARALLEKDRKIIALRESIRSSGEEQYRSGVITMTDLMSRIDDEYNAKVAESIHKIQLIMAVYDLKNCMGY